MPLKQARQVVRRKRKALGLELPKGFVFRDAFRIWCELKKGRIVSYKNEKRMIERYLLRPLSSKQLDEINAPLIIQLLRPIQNSGKQVTLKRVLMRCREILDLAVCAGYIHHNPIERLSRIYAVPEVTPMPAIKWQELPKAMLVFSTAPRKMQVLFLFSLCSMLRPGEIAKLRWNWIEEDLLTIPAEVMKKRRQHRVPLTKEMLYLLSVKRNASQNTQNLHSFSLAPEDLSQCLRRR